MIPTLSQICSLNAPFEQDLADYAAGACRSVEIWLGKLETYLDSHSLDDVRRLLDDLNVSVPVASYQGGLLLSQGEVRNQHWEHFAKRLVLCKALGIRTLVVAGDIAGPLGADEFGRIKVSLVQAAQQAEQHGVRIAWEFQANATFANNLPTAMAILDECGHPNLGICLDAFHYYVGPSKPEDLGHLTPANLFHVQLCDLAGTPREMATDGDRILPGDGDFYLTPIVERLREIHYTGAVSVELMNPRIWHIPPRQFGEIAITALRKLLGLAAME